MRLEDLFSHYYEPLRLRGKSQNTSRLYANTLRQYSRWLGRAAELSDLDDLTMSRYLTYRASHRSPLTAEKERTQLCALARLACDRGLMSVRPCVLPQPSPRRVPQAWTLEELRRLVAACETEPGEVGGVPARLFWGGLVAVLWETAARIGEILPATVADYARPRLHVAAEHRKGSRADRIYTLSSDTCEKLDAIVSRRGQRTDVIFLWDRCRIYLWPRFGKIVERAGLPGGRRSKFHALRRAAATHYASLGGDATALLDHSSPRITQRYYLDPRLIDRGPPPCDVLPRLS